MSEAETNDQDKVKIGSVLLPGDDIRQVTENHKDAKKVCQ